MRTRNGGTLIVAHTATACKARRSAPPSAAPLCPAPSPSRWTGVAARCVQVFKPSSSVSSQIRPQTAGSAPLKRSYTKDLRGTLQSCDHAGAGCTSSNVHARCFKVGCGHGGDSQPIQGNRLCQSQRSVGAVLGQRRERGLRSNMEGSAT